MITIFRIFLGSAFICFCAFYGLQGQSNKLVMMLGLFQSSLANKGVAHPVLDGRLSITELLVLQNLTAPGAASSSTSKEATQCLSYTISKLHPWT